MRGKEGKELHVAIIMDGNGRCDPNSMRPHSHLRFRNSTVASAALVQCPRRCTERLLHREEVLNDLFEVRN
jgi:undecaprenyl pyrophosphate synthase